MLAVVSGPRRVSVQGRRAEYLDVGDGLSVLFLHGWGLGVRAYRAVHDELLAQGLRVVAPALPGFGATAALPRTDISFAGYADWAAELAAAVGVEQAVVVGHSFGGGVATALAHRHPELVRALVLVNAIGGSTWRAGDDGDRPLHERPLWDWGRHLPADVLPLRRFGRVLPALLREAVPNVIRRPGSLWRVGTLARHADLTVELGALRDRGLPVVAVWGRHDRVIPEAAFRDICAALGSEGQVVEGSHSWLLADPAGFAEVISNVVARSEPATAPPPGGLVRRWFARRRVDRPPLAA